MNIKNNTILLTGGTSGIGLELLRQLYANNKIIVVSGNPSNLEKVKTEHPNITGIICDLGRIDSVKQLFDKRIHDLHQVNILINNAAIQNNYSFLAEKEGFDKIENEITINLISPLFLIYGLLPTLVKRNNAAIINISSGLAFSPKTSAPVYC